MEKAMHPPLFNGHSLLGILLNGMAIVFLEMTRYTSISSVAAFFAILASATTIAVNLKNWLSKKK